MALNSSVGASIVLTQTGLGKNASATVRIPLTSSFTYSSERPPFMYICGCVLRPRIMCSILSSPTPSAMVAFARSVASGIETLTLTSVAVMGLVTAMDLTAAPFFRRLWLGLLHGAEYDVAFLAVHGDDLRRPVIF